MPGVKVYNVVPVAVVIIVAGLHVPVMLFNDVVRNAGAVEFWHSGPMGANVGTTCGVITISIDIVVAHTPDAGEKV